MPIRGKVRFRSRKIRGGRQRIAFRNSKVVEVKTFRRGRRPVTRMIRR